MWPVETPNQDSSWIDDKVCELSRVLLGSCLLEDDECLVLAHLAVPGKVP